MPAARRLRHAIGWKLWLAPGCGQRQARADAGPGAGRAVDLEAAAQRVDPVGQPEQARPAARVGAAAAVVHDLDEQRVGLGATRTWTARAPAYLRAFVSDSDTTK